MYKVVVISQGFFTLYFSKERTEFLNVSAASIFLTSGNGFTIRLAVGASRREREREREISVVTKEISSKYHRESSRKFEGKY